MEISDATLIALSSVLIVGSVSVIFIVNCRRFFRAPVPANEPIVWE